MAVKYIAYCAEKGVFLGSMWGMGFWSNLDTAGQDMATLFDTPEEMKAYFSQAIENDFPVITYEPIEVRVDSFQHCITTAELKAQNKPYWGTEQ